MDTTRIIVAAITVFLLSYDGICMWRGWPTISRIVVQADIDTSWLVLPVLTGVLAHWWIWRICIAIGAQK